MAVTRLLLIRHGQSLWNIERRWQGQANSDLSELGRKQALKAAKKLGNVEVVLASPLGRSQQTAEIISEEIGVGPVITIPGLIERDTGEWSGKTRDYIMSSWPDWETSGYRPDGWEPDEELHERVFTAFSAIHTKFAGAQVFAVSHAGVIISLEKYFDSQRGRVPNLGGVEVFIDDSQAKIGKRVVLLDDATLESENAEL